MAEKRLHEAPKCIWTLQPNIRISYILQIYRFSYENNVWKIKVNLLEYFKY